MRMNGNVKIEQRLGRKKLDGAICITMLSNNQVSARNKVPMNWTNYKAEHCKHIGLAGFEPAPSNLQTECSPN